MQSDPFRQNGNIVIFVMLAFCLNCRFLFLGLEKKTRNHISLSFPFWVGVCGRHSVCVCAPGAWIPRWQILQKSIWRAVKLLTYRMSRAKRTVQKLNIALEHLNCSVIWLKCFLPLVPAAINFPFLTHWLCPRWQFLMFRVPVKFIFKQNRGSPCKNNYFDLGWQIFSNLKLIFLKVQAVEQWKLKLCQVDLEMFLCWFVFFWEREHARNSRSWVLVTALEDLILYLIF